MDKNKKEEYSSLIPRWTKQIKDKKLNCIKKKLIKILRKNDKE